MILIDGQESLTKVRPFLSSLFTLPGIEVHQVTNVHPLSPTHGLKQGLVEICQPKVPTSWRMVPKRCLYTEHSLRLLRDTWHDNQ